MAGAVQQRRPPPVEASYLVLLVDYYWPLRRKE